MENRPRCPFYGFRWVKEGFIESEKSNNCAVFCMEGQCVMECEGTVPNMEACYMPKGEFQEQFSRSTRKVFPKEFPGGITAKKWTKLIMKN
jgi:hypothetical protein